ncbi:MAG TPA: VWA domain-containing protein [Candidatus Acutalibacter ornithocaccae]|uniref:VWA domain-containing protein n=1 Tax=Candidatus Acutalibacter ornithocaccae TaxID=2838416 RepID=A0A9D2RZJ6_9FIRM|nr:VWA domain-containing protein [Candidatus Acutalibacter ornithocaccae]
MARVNHKKVKQLIQQKRGRITDQEFFTSRLLALHFEDVAAAQTKRYGASRRVRVRLLWQPDNTDLAYTDSLHITINAGNPAITEFPTREERYQMVLGLFAHELGHCLYTDFLTQQTYRNNLSACRWYPEKPKLSRVRDVKNEGEFWEYAQENPQNLALLGRVAHEISNVLEDAAMENRVLEQFPGTLGQALDFVRAWQWREMPTVTQLKEREAQGTPMFYCLLQLFLSYGKFGELKYGAEPLSEEHIQTVFELLPLLDNDLRATSGKNRWNTVNCILIRCWEHVREYLEALKRRYEEKKASGGTGSVFSQLEEELSTLVGGSTRGEGVTAPVSEETEGPSLPQPEKREKTHALADGNPSEEDENSGEKLSTAGVSSESAAGNRSEKQEITPEETGRMPLMETDSVSEPMGGGIEINRDYHPEISNTVEAEMERLLDTMAEKTVCQELEQDRLRELNQEAQSISYGDIHKGVAIRVNRMTEVPPEMVTQYNAIAGPLLAISKQLQKSLLRQLRDQQRGGKQTGLLMGRRLDAHALFRSDGKVFTKNALPIQPPEMAVGLLLDESGSMASCDRATYARASAIILYDFCQALRVPVMVYGHSTGGSGVELYSYSEFDAIDREDQYRLVDISARGSNRDGAALRFVAERLSHRPEELKLLILVSDGQPADTGYYGTAAEEDLRGIQQEYRRKGILFVAAAIGDDKENMERIYGDSFLDITDLNQLPVKLTQVVKRFLRV